VSRRGDDGPALFPVPPHRPGRHERHAEEAIRRARRAGRLDDVHASAASTLRGLGRAADAAEAKADPYAWAAVSREIRAWHADLGLLPTGANDADPLDDLLDGLAAGEVGDTPHP